MEAGQNEDVFYGIYHCGEMSIHLESVEPFYKALNRVAGIYIIPRSILWGGGSGLIKEHRWRNTMVQSKFVVWVAEDLPHSERLITIAHELVHLILTMQGFPFDRQMGEQYESWIDDIAKGFYQKNPDFLSFVYANYARIAA